MITKTRLISILDGLPENFTIDQLIDHIIFVEKVQNGLADLQEGRINSKDEAKQKLHKWLK